MATTTKLKVGDKIRFEGREAEVTDVVDDLKCIRCRFEDGSIKRIPWDQVTEAPAHKQVKGPAG